VFGVFIRKILTPSMVIVATARLIMAPDGSTSGAVAFLQSWKDAAAEHYAAPTTGICILDPEIF
jgi:hypothetical protein